LAIETFANLCAQLLHSWHITMGIHSRRLVLVHTDKAVERGLLPERTILFCHYLFAALNLFVHIRAAAIKTVFPLPQLPVVVSICNHEQHAEQRQESLGREHWLLGV
jgi:hypothetical protein